MQRYRRPARFGVGAVAAAVARRYGPSIANRYGSSVRRYVSNASSGIVSRMNSAISNASSARTLRVDRSRLRGRNLSSAVGVQQSAGGGGETKSSFYKVHPIKANVGKLELARSIVNRSVGLSSTSTQGLQNAVGLVASYDVSDITNIRTATGLTTAGFASTKTFLSTARSKIFITNAETTNCHITIYTCLARLDGGALNTEVATTFLAGYVDAGGGAAADGTLIGSSAYSNPRFRECYTILQSVPVVLSPGQTHVHSSTYSPNRLVAFSRATISTEGPMAGLSLHTFIVHHGTPVHDDTTETSVTMGISKIDIVVCESVGYRLVQLSYPQNSITSALATNLTGFQMAENAPADMADNS